jgi:hypothetical protein
MITSSPGSISAISASTSAPLEPLPQGGDALRGRVAVPAGVDGRLGRLAGRRRHFEIGLADREIDRVFEPGREVEDLADARRIEGPGPLRDHSA